MEFGSFCKSEIGRSKGLGESVMETHIKTRLHSWDTKIKVSDADVPLLLYRSEVCGYSCLKMVEVAQLYFFKQILLLGKATPS